MIDVYYWPTPNGKKVTIQLEEEQAPYNIKAVNIGRGDQLTSEFLKISPNGRMPAIVDHEPKDGGAPITVFESGAIMLYLAEKNPGHAAYPPDARARADINRWVFWNAQHFQPTISIFVWENLIKGMIGQGPADPVQIRRGQDLLERYGPVLNTHLASRRWVCGDSVTLADLAIGATLLAAVPANVPLAPYRDLLTWFARVQALEAWKETAS